MERDANENMGYAHTQFKRQSIAHKFLAATLGNILIYVFCSPINIGFLQIHIKIIYYFFDGGSFHIHL